MDCDEPPEVIAELMRMAHQMCFTEDALGREVAVEVRRVVNGELPGNTHEEEVSMHTTSNTRGSEIEIEYTSEPTQFSDYSYAREKLGLAVHILATGVEGIRARLYAAYIEMAPLQETDFPPELAGLWKSIVADLTSGKMQFELEIQNKQLFRMPVGLLSSTLRFMRKAKAQSIAERIYQLTTRLDDRDYGYSDYKT